MKLNREYSGDLFLDLVLYYFSKLTLALSRIRLTSFTVESSSLLGNFTFVLFSRQLILRLLLRLDEVVIEVGGDLPNVYTAGTSLFIVLHLVVYFGPQFLIPGILMVILLL